MIFESRLTATSREDRILIWYLCFGEKAKLSDRMILKFFVSHPSGLHLCLSFRKPIIWKQKEIFKRALAALKKGEVAITWEKMKNDVTHHIVRLIRCFRGPFPSITQIGTCPAKMPPLSSCRRCYIDGSSPFCWMQMLPSWRSFFHFLLP